MAGAGKKTFTAGEVLTASDTNTYLMEQTVMYFAGTAARASAIPTPSTGMTSYIGVTGTASIPQIETYTGSAWQTPYGLSLIAKASFTSASSVSVQGCFTSAYQNYRVFCDTIFPTANGQNGFALLSGASQATLNYNSAGVGFGSGAAAANNANEGGTAEMRWGSLGSAGSTFTIDIFRPALATQTRFLGNNFAFNGSTPIATSSAFAGVHTNTTAYDGFIIPFLQANGATGNAASGTIYVYGYRNS
jgi:hypothetical protein